MTILESAHVKTGHARAAALGSLYAIITLFLASIMWSFAADNAIAGLAKKGIFESYEKQSDNINIFTKWTSVLRRAEAERALEGEQCQAEGGSWCVLKRWRAYLNTLREKAPNVQIAAINQFVNRVPYISDQRNYQIIDHWATPRQFFSRGGDCEDYAIVKYLSLRALGWPPDKMRLAVVMDKRKRQVHAILVVYFKKRIVILDNQDPNMVDNTATKRYRPIYSINERHWWYHIASVPRQIGHDRK
jgi:predicted transglutaminase-like cysteine proteinase